VEWRQTKTGRLEARIRASGTQGEEGVRIRVEEDAAGGRRLVVTTSGGKLSTEDQELVRDLLAHARRSDSELDHVVHERDGRRNRDTPGGSTAGQELEKGAEDDLGTPVAPQRESEGQYERPGSTLSIMV
jgi:hypothetical protein